MAQCSKTVSDPHGFTGRKCANRAVEGTALCKTHSPEATASRREKATARYGDKDRAYRALNALINQASEADRGIIRKYIIILR